MENCIFCKIVRGEVPSHKVYEDDDFLAFLGIPAISPGYTLVIPKAHYRWVWDVPNAGQYFEIAQKIARAQQKAFETDEIYSKILGEEVPHAHIWIYPNAKTAQGTKDDLQGNVIKLRAAL
jgi:histidine triad (HIT) family protein